jgi:hypothetical protein
MSDLMSAIQLPLTLAQRHNNQQLFSDHYVRRDKRHEQLLSSRKSD